MKTFLCLLYLALTAPWLEHVSFLHDQKNVLRLGNMIFLVPLRFLFWLYFSFSVWPELREFLWCYGKMKEKANCSVEMPSISGCFSTLHFFNTFKIHLEDWEMILCSLNTLEAGINRQKTKSRMLIQVSWSPLILFKIWKKLSIWSRSVCALSGKTRDLELS